ncbi:uncharacterized protein BO87DRAFT_155898 [Aspergillus neoniger CBS 115656]|uniref:Uncharacterized protein n=1 Tax=Aspergillus neoniger (strain CBS 115656) TaxID=1448310 RepID=A0A318YA50_ASPNB|nr:hypothetical protein BO87DRAFT_155898 [Aspergillus neoniger CBS 115656]PYH30457.1 hypothetical protein BO87DRAFT_155898 [Aspergillus neoniger CBS 115656]
MLSVVHTTRVAWQEGPGCAPTESNMSLEGARVHCRRVSLIACSLAILALSFRQSVWSYTQVYQQARIRLPPGHPISRYCMGNCLVHENLSLNPPYSPWSNITFYGTTSGLTWPPFPLQYQIVAPYRSVAWAWGMLSSWEPDTGPQRGPVLERDIS